MRPIFPVLLLLLSACVQKAELRPVEPRRIEVAGDTARFGPGVTAMDVAGRVITLDLRRDATVLFFRYSTMSGTRFLAERRFRAGVHETSPRAGSWEAGRDLHHPTDALLVIVTVGEYDEDPLRGMRWGSVLMNTSSAYLALNELPPTLMRTRDQIWAAYLVAM